ncbi:hypothetical protein CFC21_094761, partial [Triticum aestivum]
EEALPAALLAPLHPPPPPAPCSMSHLPSSSHGLRTLREEEEAVGELITGQHELPPTISPTQEAGGDDVAAADDIGAGKFTVSRRAVPQGPNPLHN